MRLFVGIPAPPGPHEALTQALLERAPDARPVPPESWHVTLRFLGDVEDPMPVAAALDEALAGRPALPCRIEGRGAFPKPSQARVAWLGVDAPGLEALARCVVDATGGFGQPPDRRRFRPHVTLARLKRPADLRPWVQQEAPGEAGHLAEVVLYRSELGPDGPSYVPLHRWSLSDPAP